MWETIQMALIYFPECPVEKFENGELRGLGRILPGWDILSRCET